MNRSKLTALLLALIMIVTTVDGAVFAASVPAGDPETGETEVCKTEDALQADFEAAAAEQFKKVGKKDGLYIGSYDQDNHKVTVAILDGTQSVKGLKNTGLFVGLEDLYLNHNLTKIQIGKQAERDLKQIYDKNPAKFKEAMSILVILDIENEIPGESKTSKLSQFVDQSIDLKFTLQQEGCDHAVTINYTVEGKGAKELLEGKLAPAAIGAFVDDAVDWKEGVALNEENKDDAFLQAILDAATVKDKTDPVRTTDSANEDGIPGTLLVTFKDGTTLDVPDQTLYVYENGAKKPEDKPVPSNAVEVNFARDEKSVEDFGTVDPIIVKKGTTVDPSKFPKAEAKDGYHDLVWTPAKDTAVEKDTTFKASASITKVIPYVPADSNDPTNKKDKNIPVKDPDGNPIDSSQYFIVAMKTENHRRGTLRKNGIRSDVISVLVKKDEDITFNDIKATAIPKDGYEFSHWDKNGRTQAFGNKAVSEGDIFTAHFDKRASGSIVLPPKDDENNDKPIENVHGTHAAYLKGYPDGTIMPDGNITRAESATIIAKLKGLSLDDSSKPAFSDTPSSWYNGAINAVVEANLMRGYPDGTFKPNEKISRAEFAQMIKAIDLPNRELAPFSDIKGHWAEDAINQAYGNGRIQGYPDGMFKPDAPITRAEAVTIANNLFDRSIDGRGLTKKLENPRHLRTFKDLSETHWAYYDIIEASNSHDFQRRDTGKVMEDWININ
ncbi:MAG: S-layer homology domain-containing protein [Peptoniphilus sp.]|nr:S-layer homology domain-containing protein [Peptoniphilus sp.]MDD7363808.1 S-layer homology domain-containing protein [Bacillota bacterium]MDY6044649.1 S-layer homology domain-containing protein [Peptoniphilus sp.]